MLRNGDNLIYFGPFVRSEHCLNINLKRRDGMERCETLSVQRGWDEGVGMRTFPKCIDGRGEGRLGLTSLRRRFDLADGDEEHKRGF